MKIVNATVQLNFVKTKQLKTNDLLKPAPYSVALETSATD